MLNISDPKNRDLYAVVSVGYNRLPSQKRLLESLKNADYAGHNNVPLVISIDCSGDTALYQYAQNFEWPHGDKYVIIREKRMGLKEHILTCGDLTEYFKGIILMEDDLFVSSNYYSYVCQMEDAYGDCDKVASIGLYSNEINGFCWLPFDRLKNGADVYAIQSVCTWGEAWNSRMWSTFRKWLSEAEIDWDTLDVPEAEKKWERAWSKLFDAYLVMTDRYSIFPDVSVSTNFSDAGEHSCVINDSIRFQSTLQYGERIYQVLPFDMLLKYDAHFNSMNLFDALGVKREDICIDCYGDRKKLYGKRYYLSVNPMPFKVIKSYGFIMRPWEMNILNNIDGDDIFLYDTFIKDAKPISSGLEHRVMYYQKGFNSLMVFALLKGNIRFILKKIKMKLYKKIIR